MQSNNPVFRNSDEFNGRNAYGNQTHSGNGAAYPGYGAPASGTATDPSSWSTGSPTHTETSSRPMTIDSVVMATAASFGVVLVAAVLTWLWIGDVTTNSTIGAQQNASQLMTAVLLGSGVAFVLSLVNSFKRVISPALVLVFCAAEGVALGGVSKLFEVLYSGIVMQAVLGTFGAFAGTLAAYKFFDIKVGQKFRTFVIAGVFGMVGLSVLSLVLGLFGVDTGLFGFGALGLLMAVAGLVLGIFMLILDFDFVENGIRAGLPERESWRAAFGLTVSLVWIYTNLLRILAIMRGD